MGSCVEQYSVSRSSKLLCLPKAIIQIVYNINSMAFVDFSHLFGGHFGDANCHGMLFALTIDCNWLACFCLQNIQSDELVDVAFCVLAGKQMKSLRRCASALNEELEACVTTAITLAHTKQCKWVGKVSDDVGVRCNSAILCP